MAGPENMLIPHLVISDAAGAIEFYKKAFGAQEVSRFPEQGGTRLMHAAMTFGASTIFMCDEFPEYCGGKARNPRALGATPFILHQNVPDCDAAIQKAHAAGATVVMPAADQFWGDRYGVVEDPFGYQWSFSHPLQK